MSTEDRILASMGVPPSDSPGDRVVGSDGYYELLTRDDKVVMPLGSQGTVIDPLLDSYEVRDLLRQRSTATAAQPASVPPYVGLQAKPVRVPNLVTTVVTDRSRIESLAEAGVTGTAGGVPEEAALSEITDLDLTRDPVSMDGYFGCWGRTPRFALSDPGYVKGITNRLLEREFNRRLEVEMLTGDGSQSGTVVQQLGVLNTTGISTYAKQSGQSVADALADGVRIVQEAGFYDEPIAVAATPATLKAARVNGLLDGILTDVALIPTTALPAGTALAGAFGRAVLFIHKGLKLTFADSHQDFWVKGLVAVRADAKLAFRVPQSTAFTKVTGV